MFPQPSPTLVHFCMRPHADAFSFWSCRVQWLPNGSTRAPNNVVFAKLVLIFILVPLADLFLLMALSRYTGLAFSIALVVLSGIIGAWLAKRQSSQVRQEIIQRLKQNQMSAGLLTDGAMIFFAAGLLLTPGFITDAVGLSLLIPACRKWYKRVLMVWLGKNVQVKVFQQGAGTTGRPSNDRTSSDPNIIEGEVLHRSEST